MGYECTEPQNNVSLMFDLSQTAASIEVSGAPSFDSQHPSATAVYMMIDEGMIQNHQQYWNMIITLINVSIGRW